MATKVAKKKEDNTKSSKNLDNWKFPKIPVHQLYKKQPFKFFPKCKIKDFESPIEVVSNSKYTSLNLLPWSFMKRFSKKKHEFIHLGLVQVAINPLVRDGLDAPITVCLRDDRQPNFRDSWLAVVETNMSQGPFYFNCFPGFSVSRTDIAYDDESVLNLRIKSTGMAFAFSYRVVYKAIVDLSAEYLEEPVLGKTAYYRTATSSTAATTVWDEVELEDDEKIAQKKQQDYFNGLFERARDQNPVILQRKP